MISSEHLGFKLGNSLFISEIFRQKVFHAVLVDVGKELKEFVLAKNTMEIFKRTKFGSVRNGRVLVHGQKFCQIVIMLLEKVGVVLDAVVRNIKLEQRRRWRQVFGLCDLCDGAKEPIGGSEVIVVRPIQQGAKDQSNVSRKKVMSGKGLTKTVSIVGVK